MNDPLKGKKVEKLMENFVIYALTPLCKRREIVYNKDTMGTWLRLCHAPMIKAGDGRI